ncbi:MAG: DUF2236 domain-containing protein, partial [Bacteroidota bacterium]
MVPTDPEVARRRYRKRLWIFRNRRIQRDIRTLDPDKDHTLIVQLMSGYEFPWDVQRALEVALFKTYASPRISLLLDRTGEFRRAGQKRYDDTALIVQAFMQHGYEEGLGAEAIARMNKMHSFFRIENVDYLYTLCTFVLCPIDWINRYAWRRLHAVERAGFARFFHEVGLRMGLTDVPKTEAEFRAFAAEYEEAHFQYVESNKRIGDATLDIIKGWIPRFGHGLVRPTVLSLLSRADLAAFNYAPPSRWYAGMVRLGLKARGAMSMALNVDKAPATLENYHARA